jgi:hypothetical protein
VLFVDHVIDEEQTAEKLKSSQLPPMEPQKRIEEPELSQAVEALKASGAPVHID